MLDNVIDSLVQESGKGRRASDRKATPQAPARPQAELDAIRRLQEASARGEHYSETVPRAPPVLTRDVIGNQPSPLDAAVQSLMAPQVAQSPIAAPQPPQAAPQAQGLPWQQRFTQGLVDPFNAGAQLLTRTAPMQGIQALGNAVGGPVGETIGGMRQSVDDVVKNREAQYQAQRGDAGIDWTRAAGSLANPISWLGPGTAAPTFASAAARGAVGSTLATPVTSGDFLEEKLKQGAAGAVGGMAIKPVAGALARVISPQTDDAAKTLMQSGVKLTPGKILGGGFQRAEEGLTSIPFTGDFVRGGMRRAVEDFNRATYQRALDPIGEKAPKIAGHEGVLAVRQALQKRYDALIPKLSFSPDAQFNQEFQTIRHMVQSGLPDEQVKQFDRIVSAEFSKATPAGLMSGDALKGALSEIRRKASGFKGDASFNNRELGNALDALHSSLTSGMGRTNPAHAAELKAIDTGWAHYARIRDAAARQGAEDGVFTPAQLSAAVRAQDKSTGKGRFSEGDALLQDMSNAGKKVLGSKVPDSGTPLRSIMTGSNLMGVLLGLPGGAVTAPLYSDAGKTALKYLLSSRPDFAPTIANAARLGLPSGAAVSGALLRDLTAQ